jgi:hypothetical protein
MAYNRWWRNNTFHHSAKHKLCSNCRYLNAITTTLGTSDQWPERYNVCNIWWLFPSKVGQEEIQENNPNQPKYNQECGNNVISMWQ